MGRNRTIQTAAVTLLVISMLLTIAAPVLAQGEVFLGMRCSYAANGYIYRVFFPDRNYCPDPYRVGGGYRGELIGSEEVWW
jgi:hypothetical protein